MRPGGKMIDKFIQRQTGSMLIETVISCAVVGIGALALAKLQADLVSGSNHANLRAEATIIAQEKIETLRRQSDDSTYSNIASANDSITVQNAVFTRTWTSTDITSPNYKKIDVTVAWTGMGGGSESVTLSSIVTENNLKDSGRLTRILNTESSLSSGVNEAEEAGDQTINDNLPDGATDNGDGTSNYTPVGTNLTLTYDNTSAEITKLNGSSVVRIDGAVSKATGGSAPHNSTTLENMTIVAQPQNTTMAMYCASASSEDAASYTCYATSGWGGTITLGGINKAVKVCTNTSQAYSNLTSSLTNQDYKLFKTSKSCSGDTPTHHQDYSP